MPLCQDVGNHFSRDVGQAEVPAVEAVGEFGVFESQHSQQGRVQVIDVDLVDSGFVSVAP